MQQTETITLNAQIDPEITRKAQQVLKELDISMSAAISGYLTKLIQHKSIPADTDFSILSTANAIKTMNDVELETLSLLLTPDYDELLERKKDIESHRDGFMTREEVFDV